MKTFVGIDPGASGSIVSLGKDNNPSKSFIPKLAVLDMLLAQKKIDFNTDKYVDLRFNEPVLGENNK